MPLQDLPMVILDAVVVCWNMLKCRAIDARSFESIVA